MSDRPTPQSVARQARAVRVERSECVTGDSLLDDVLTPLEESVTAFVSAADGAPRSQTQQGPPHADAADVVTRAHEAHQALQSRLKDAQA